MSLIYITDELDRLSLFGTSTASGRSGDTLPVSGNYRRRTPSNSRHTAPVDDDDTATSPEQRVSSPKRQRTEDDTSPRRVILPDLNATPPREDDETQDVAVAPPQEIDEDETQDVAVAPPQEIDEDETQDPTGMGVPIPVPPRAENSAPSRRVLLAPRVSQVQPPSELENAYREFPRTQHPSLLNNYPGTASTSTAAAPEEQAPSATGPQSREVDKQLAQEYPLSSIKFIHMKEDVYPSPNSLSMYSTIEDYLAPNQLEIVRRGLSQRKKKRGLAVFDDPGLGKTLATLALTSAIAGSETSTKRPFTLVVVCPASVVGEWLSHIARHTDFDVFDRDNLDEEREKTGAGHDTRRIRVAVVTYGISLSTSSFGFFIRDHVDMLVFDEAHILRNEKTQRSIAWRSAADDARVSGRNVTIVALTATPLVNRVEDLQSVCNLIGYGDEYPARVWRKAERENITKALDTFVIRHDRRWISNLVGKTMLDVIVPMTDDEALVYRQRVRRFITNGFMTRGMNSWRKLSDVLLSSLGEVLRAPQLDGPEGVTQRSRKVRSIISARTKRSVFVKSIDVIARLYNDVKVNEEDPYEVPEKKKKRGVVVFTNSLVNLEAIMAELEAMKETSFPGAKVWTIHGRVSAVKRTQIIENFNKANPPGILVCSTLTGGVGINLAAGGSAAVFAGDVWWNHAMHEQAYSRVWRRGQVRECRIVYVYPEGSPYHYIKRDVISAKEKMLRIVLGESTREAEGSLSELFNADEEVLDDTAAGLDNDDGIDDVAFGPARGPPEEDDDDDTKIAFTHKVMVNMRAFLKATWFPGVDIVPPQISSHPLFPADDMHPNAPMWEYERYMQLTFRKIEELTNIQIRDNNLLPRFGKLVRALPDGTYESFTIPDGEDGTSLIPDENMRGERYVKIEDVRKFWENFLLGAQRRDVLWSPLYSMEI